MASPQVLDEGMALDDDAGRSVLFQSAHRAKSGLESPIIGFDPVVGVLGCVMECSRQELCYRSDQGVGPVSGDLDRFAMGGDRRGKNRFAAFRSRFVDTNTSTTCPYWSTVR